MKKLGYLLGSLALLITTNSYALVYAPGPYLGGQIGWGRIDAGEGYSKYASKNEELGKFTAWRAYLGYSFNPAFSIESGYSYYPANEYTGDTNNANVKSYTIDVVAKMIFPLEKLGKPFTPFSIYGKAGAAYINTKAELGTITKLSDTITPAYGAGIVFSFTDNIAVDLSWTGVMGRGYANNAGEAQNKTPVANCNMFTLGLSYKITGIF